MKSVMKHDEQQWFISVRRTPLETIGRALADNLAEQYRVAGSACIGGGQGIAVLVEAL